LSSFSSPLGLRPPSTTSQSDREEESAVLSASPTPSGISVAGMSALFQIPFGLCFRPDFASRGSGPVFFILTYPQAFSAETCPPPGPFPFFEWRPHGG